MTKIEALKKVMQDNGGLANWVIIYNEIENYYPSIRQPEQWEAALRGVLYREINNNKHFKKIDKGLFALIEHNENSLILDEDINDTETPVVVKMRRGQDKFRKELLKKLKPKCPITEINDKRLLIASHIKPWAFSNNRERLDTNNGLILSAMFDRLFDEGLITFSCDKRLIISNSLSNANIERLSIKNNQIIKNLLIKGREEYLDYHKNKVFLK